jgi:hypothetical protein
MLCSGSKDIWYLVGAWITVESTAVKEKDVIVPDDSYDYNICMPVSILAML